MKWKRNRENDEEMMNDPMAYQQKLEQEQHAKLQATWEN